jgi:epoxyqueuosine reductase
MDYNPPNNHTGIITEVARDYEYQYRVMSVDHFDALQEDIDRLERAKLLSNEKLFRDILNGMRFTLPADFPDARSVIILAVISKPMLVNFHLNGEKHEVILPHQYYDDGLTAAMLLDEVRTNILPAGDHRLERGENLHLKLLAVRSGLGRYGRNNIFYAGGLGSFLALHAFLTDCSFDEDNWHELAMLDQCEKCRICRNQCPTGAIRDDRFLIDVSRCITLYSENGGDFPGWVPANAYNALIGCMRCQGTCPENRQVLNFIGRFDDISENETRQFLSGDANETTLESIGRKLKVEHLFKTREGYQLLRRNLSVLLPAPV